MGKRGFGQVDNAPPDKRAAVIDSDDNALAVSGVGDLDLRSKGQLAVRSRACSMLIPLAVSCFTALKPVCIERGLAGLFISDPFSPAA